MWENDIWKNDCMLRKNKVREKWSAINIKV